MKKLMIVEDDPMLVEIYEKKFTEVGMEVKAVMSGRDVVREADKWQPDLILLDIVLPDLDGFEVLEELAKNKKTKQINTYVFSNLGNREDIDRATKLGAKGFLNKASYTPSELVSEVRKIMDSGVIKGNQETNPQNAPEAENIPSDNIKEMKPEHPNGKKILIIEDEDVFIEIFGEKFREAGYDVTAAKNGKWGLAEAKNGKYDCILMDMVMPAMNGMDAVREIKADSDSKNTPIIILSNSVQESEMKAALELGASAYYVKTQITPGEIVEKAKELIK